VRAVQRLVEQGRLNWSSGSLPHLVEVAADGRIKRWPIVEGSLTPAPAEPRRTDARTIKSAYEAAGLRSELRVLSAELKDTTEENMQDEMDIMQVEDERPARKRLPVASADEALKVRIQVGSPFDRLEAMDLLHGYMMLRSAKSFHGVSEPFANALAHKVSRAGLSAIKANELSHSTQTGFGDEWVPDLWSAQIWQKARLENVITAAVPGAGNAVQPV
jgi:hypothetical protein